MVIGAFVALRLSALLSISDFTKARCHRTANDPPQEVVFVLPKRGNENCFYGVFGLEWGCFRLPYIVPNTLSV